MKLPKINQSGFTIVELIVTLGVVLILVVGINSIYVTYMVQSNRVRSLALVNSFVENKIEALRSAGFLSLNDGSYDLSSELPEDLYVPKNASMQIAAANSGLKDVTLTINYNDSGSTRTFVYQTYIGEVVVGQY